ncbi:MAG: glycosyltransferase [Prevotella sp.]|nr:glycosyltransferase [Prevotella sp.]
MTRELTCKQISILLPVYNHVCISLVRELHQQAEACGVVHEIIVADDGSTDTTKIEANRDIGDIPCCTYIVRETNAGRAAIRNFLARSAVSEWLLFLDCDVDLPDADFIRRYVDAAGEDVIDGGVCTDRDTVRWQGNLRFAYERASEPRHVAIERAAMPYRCFRTTNFMVRRAVILAYPFDERFRFYGYEDVLFGKRLKEERCTIRHIDNPVVIGEMEPNGIFLEKTEEALRTLYMFRDELRGYSDLLDLAERLCRFIPGWLLHMFYSLVGPLLRRNLIGGHPNLTAFGLYRLGYYLSLTNKT